MSSGRDPFCVLFFLSLLNLWKHLLPLDLFADVQLAQVWADSGGHMQTVELFNPGQQNLKKLS